MIFRVGIDNEKIERNAAARICGRTSSSETAALAGKIRGSGLAFPSVSAAGIQFRDHAAGFPPRSKRPKSKGIPGIATGILLPVD